MEKTIQRKKKKTKEEKIKERAAYQRLDYYPRNDILSKRSPSLIEGIQVCKASLQRVEDDINAYLRTVAGKLKLFNEVRNRMQVIEENQVKVQDEYQNIFNPSKSRKQIRRYEEQSESFRKWPSYNLHKFRSKEEAINV